MPVGSTKYAALPSRLGGSNDNMVLRAAAGRFIPYCHALRAPFLTDVRYRWQHPLLAHVQRKHVVPPSSSSQFRPHHGLRMEPQVRSVDASHRYPQGHGVRLDDGR